MPPQGQTGWMHNVFYVSVRPSVRSFVCYQTGERDILKTIKPILLQIGTKLSRGEGMNRSTLGLRIRISKVKDRMRLKIGLEAWPKHHSPIEFLSRCATLERD